MLISVIVCTYLRPGPLGNLLRSLAAQVYREFEVLVVDGSGGNSPITTVVEAFAHNAPVPVRLIARPKGLTRQRNEGLRQARGSILCFLDDDVTVNPHFLSTVAAIFARTGNERVGGLSAYDVLHYPQRVNLRWRVRRLLRVVPRLEGGTVDRFGRSVPVSFLRPFTGLRPVGFFHGCCMIYRRAAIDGLWFDEGLPTYGGEDRDYSFRVGQRWQLMLSGDLTMEHHSAPEARDSAVHRTWQAAFGTGRTFAKTFKHWWHYAVAAHVLAADFSIDCLTCLLRPSRAALLTPFARSAGLLAGLRSDPS
jgi:glycosyltransferase involved in cell wall biosynthesis